MLSDNIQDVGLDDDGDFELNKKLLIAYELYMNGASTKEAARKSDLKEWVVVKYVYQTNEKGRVPWADQRKKIRKEYVQESANLTKMSLSRAFRSTSDVLTKALEKIAIALDENKLSPQEAIKAADVLLRGTEKLNTIFTAPNKSPLINLAINHPKELTDAEAEKNLLSWGLEEIETEKTTKAISKKDNTEFPAD